MSYGPWTVNESGRFRSVSFPVSKTNTWSPTDRSIGQKLKVSTLQSYNPTSYSINAYTFMANTTFNLSVLPPICVVIWIYFLYYSPWRVRIWRKQITALVLGDWKGVQLSMPFYQHSAAIYLRSCSYLVDNISPDIVTEHWCQVCIPTSNYDVFVPLRLPALVSSIAQSETRAVTSTGGKIQNDVHIDTYFCKPELIALL